MARGRKETQVEGQLCFDFCTESSKYVVQANELINGRQALKLNSAKLIRAAIMQIRPDDKEIKPYIVKIKDFARLLNIDVSNVYKYAEDLTDDIIENPVYIKQQTGKVTKWVKIPWVSYCEYNSDAGIAIKLNDLLKPFLLQLKEHYTQMTLGEILAMRSVYAIRIFEMIQSRIMTKVLPKEGVHIVITVQDLRECCDCTDKLQPFSNFKKKALDPAVSEIERVTMYRINYTYVKKGRSVVAIDFYVNVMYHMEVIEMRGQSNIKKK